MLKIIKKWIRKAGGRSERRRRRKWRTARFKVGVSYSVWDGEELLEFAIRSIRSEVDYVNVVWQRLSWYGNPCDSGLEAHLFGLKEKGLIDELLFFEPDLELSPNINETNKRNKGLEAARRNGCTHFLTLDSDEFFDADEFREACEYVVRNGITHSACNQFVYHSTTLRDSFPAGWFAPFLYQISCGEKFVCNAFGESPWMLDPSKKIPISSQSKICFLGKITMHHFTNVRKDMNRKVENSSGLQNPQMVRLHKERLCTEKQILEEKVVSGDCVQVGNRFDIHL